MHDLKLGASLALLVASASPAIAADQPRGVIVARVLPGRAAERAGLEAGDRLLRWEQDAAQGSLSSPFDLAELELERGPRGLVLIVAERGQEPVLASLVPDDWGLEVLPAFAGEAAALHDEARRQIETGNVDAGIATLRECATRAAAATPDAWPWVLLEIARAEQARGRLDALEPAIREAAAAARASERQTVEAQLWTFLGVSLMHAGRLGPAGAALGEALAIRRGLDAQALATAALREPIGMLAFARGAEDEEALRGLQDARSLQARLAPCSLALARTLLALGLLSSSAQEIRQHLESAIVIAEDVAPDSVLLGKLLAGFCLRHNSPQRVAIGRRAVAILERLDPGGLELAWGYMALASALRGHDLQEAEEYFARALALEERLAPEGLSHAIALNALAIFEVERGHLAEAEALYRRALELHERVTPGSTWVAGRLYNLGDVLFRRREFDEARTYLERALEIAGTASPDGDIVARCLVRLALVAHERGDEAAAEPPLRRALAIFRSRNIAPQIPRALGELGRVVERRGRLDEAAALYKEAIGLMWEKNVVLADVQHAFGNLELRRGNLDVAETQHREALEHRQALMPDSIWEAESSHALGVVLRRKGDRQQALALFRRSVAALEAQSRALGGSFEARASFRAHYQEYYRDLEELLLETGAQEEAFGAVERSRARGLVALLATRDLRIEAPSGLEAERRQVDQEHDRILQRLGAGASLGDGERAGLRQQLVEARRRQEDVRARIRAASPRLSALRDPEPLDLAGVRRVLDPGTLLLAYSLAPSGSRLYAIGPGAEPLSVHGLGATEPEIRSFVERFREQVEARRGAALQGSVEELSHRLGRLLLGPVAARVTRAERLLVVPDGVLHLVPFAALQDPAAAGKRRYMVEAKPIHVVSSVTLYTQLLRPRGAEAARLASVIGFGDPIYPGTAAAGASPLRQSLGAGLQLMPLPATRRELEAVRSLSPGSARLFLGAEATEERAKSLDPEAGVVHFAAHGFVDEAFPLESGLALTMPREPAGRRENGLLQAWEIFEGLRLDADLVTLSACQTALGKEVAGEGLLGLTWAFQYAGARSVIASLWAVHDASTAELMRHFYDNLRAGQPKAEALRRAQVSLLHRPVTSPPFFWAAFELIGDWR